MSKKNKLVFGFDKFYYAPYQENPDGSIGTWEDPVRIPGAVKLALTSAGDSATFSADNSSYYTYTQDNGFTGDLTMAKFPDEFLIAALNWALDKNGMLVEAANVPQKPFAMLFELSGTDEPVRVVVYYCLGAKPNKDIETSEGGQQAHRSQTYISLQTQLRPSHSAGQQDLEASRLRHPAVLRVAQQI